MKQLIPFRDDYSVLGHPRMMEALQQAANEQNLTYGKDQYSLEAARLIKNHVGEHCYVHLVVGGTQANIVNLGIMMRPYEAIIACDTGHIACLETGAIEALGHKIITVKNHSGKLRPNEIEHALKLHNSEHMVLPRVVYISQTTEVGSIYSKAELQAISDCCKKHGLYLYLDGARLGSALMAKGNDLDLASIASMVDMFYLGGTKNGGLLGEAIVIPNQELQSNFRHAIKQRGALLAKGSVLGIQFVEFFKDDFYFELARHANDMALKLAGYMQAKGVEFKIPPQTNQIFPILPPKVVEELEKHFVFYRWTEEDDGRVSIRLVTSWATQESEVEQFGKVFESL